MADLEHSVIADPNIHEPKDISSATSGTVYTADGAGSGSWSSIPANQPENEVIVNALEDFPAPVGDVITLANNTQYTIGPLVNLGVNRIVLGVNSVLRGINRQLSGLVSTTTGTFITATGVDCRLTCLAIGAINAPVLVAFDGGGTKTLRLEDVESFTHPGIAVTCTDAVSCLLVFSLFVGGTDGIILSGTNNINFLMDISAFTSFTGKGVDFGTSTWDDSSITGSLFSGDSGSFSISGAASSANINSGRRMSVVNNTFNGLGTPLETIDPEDIRYVFRENTNIRDTQIAGQMTLANSALTTTLAAATPTKINATTWSAFIEDRFTVDSSGTLTYIGEEDIEAFVNSFVTGSGSSGSNEFNLYIAKNGTEIVESKARATFPSTSDTGLMCFTLVTLSTNDYLEIFVEQAGGTNFEAKDANMTVKA